MGADLMVELKKMNPNIRYWGVGGEKMMQNGFHSIHEIESLNIIGFTEILKKYGFLKSLLKRVVSAIQEQKPKLIILIDYPGFNLRLANEIRHLGIPIVFYVSPQIWAWKFNRIYKIKKNIDLMLTLFPFEEKIYQEYGVNAKFVGHPIGKRIEDSIKLEPILPKLEPHSIKIGLLPGSRRSEIELITEPLLLAAKKFHTHFQENKKSVEFIIPNINKYEETYIQTAISQLKNSTPNIKIHYIANASLRTMQTSDLVLVASGTATLETCYFLKPMVLVYKTKWLNFIIGSLLIDAKFIGLVNILSGRRVVRELLQGECNPDTIFQEGLELLNNPKYRKEQIENLTKIKTELGNGNGARIAALTIADFLKKRAEQALRSKHLPKN